MLSGTCVYESGGTSCREFVRTVWIIECFPPSVLTLGHWIRSCLHVWQRGWNCNQCLSLLGLVLWTLLATELAQHNLQRGNSVR